MRPVEYPRPAQFVGTSEQLRLLAEGSSELNRALFADYALSIGLAGAAMAGSQFSVPILGVGVPVAMALIGAIAYPAIQKIGEGANWTSAQKTLATLGVAFGVLIVPFYLNLGHATVQALAIKRMREFGVDRRRFKSQRQAVEARIAEMRAREASG